MTGPRCQCWLNLLAAPAGEPYPEPPPGRMSPYCYTCWKAGQADIVPLHLWERPREAVPVTLAPVVQRKGLGDLVAWALKKIGITPRLVARITGKPCNCRSRQARLNRWGWAVWDKVRKAFSYSRGN